MPVCVAVRVHVPVPTSVTVLPTTEHTEAELLMKVIDKPDEAVALSPIVELNSVVFAIGLNVMTWLALVTVNERLTLGAGLNSALPVCVAVMVQVPVPMSTTVLPVTEHTDAVVLVNVTVNPDDAVALRPNEELSSVVFEIGLNVMVWSSMPMMTVNVRDTDSAGL